MHSVVGERSGEVEGGGGGGGELNEQLVITEDRTGVKQKFKSWVSTEKVDFDTTF